MRPVGPLLAALAGLLALAGAERLLAPPLVELADAPRHEGSRVAVEGWVAEARAGPRGAYLEIADGRVRLPALVLGDLPALRGDLVRAVGVVGRDGAKLVLSAERLLVLDRPAAAVSVGDALDRLADGAPLRVEGVHLRGALRDGDAGLPLEADDPPPEGPLVVEGVLRLDRARAAYRLEVRAWTRP